MVVFAELVGVYLEWCIIPADCIPMIDDFKLGNKACVLHEIILPRSSDKQDFEVVTIIQLANLHTYAHMWSVDGRL